MPQNIKKSKDDKNQMQRRLSNEITKSIQLCDFPLILLSGGELGSPPQELEFHGPVGPGNSSPLIFLYTVHYCCMFQSYEGQNEPWFSKRKYYQKDQT